MKHYKYIVVLIMLCMSPMLLAQNLLDENGKKHGLWKGVYEDSKRLKYEGEFDHGVEKGKFTFYDNTKAKKVIATRDFSANDGSAYTIFYDGKFKVSEGKVVNKLYDGEWKYYHFQMDQLMSVENYKLGILQGPRKVFYKTGEIAEESMYKNGKLHGVYKKIAENGIVLEESNYVDGEYHGSVINREGDGKKQIIGQYKNGVAVGIWKYYENDKLIKEENKTMLSNRKAKPIADPNKAPIKRKVKDFKE
jgi:antitoxin component YwqK of YwqJK toxin-antitoxin module